MALRRSAPACAVRPCSAATASIVARFSGRTLATDDVLVRGEAELAVIGLGDAAHPGEQRRASGQVAQAPVLDEEGQVEAAVLALGPAVAVGVRGEGERPRLAEALAD